LYQVNVVASAPFVVTAPNTTGISWNSGSSQTITWDVGSTNIAPISCANVSIELSTDGGLTFPITIAASTANDGTETITVPNNPTTQARIRVKAVGNIFFDINNANFTIVAANPDFDFATPAPATVACAGPTSAAINLATTQTLGYSVPINLSATAGVPPGSAVNFSVNPVNPGSSVNVTLTNTNNLTAGNYDITIQGVSGAITKTRVIRFTVQPGAGPGITTNPLSQIICAGSNVTFTSAATGALSQQWQVSTDGGTTWNNVAGQTAASYTITGAASSLNNNRYRCVFTGQCNTTNSTAAALTVQTAPALTAQPTAASICSGSNTTFTVAATGSVLTYQWELSTNGGTSYSAIGGATTDSYTVSNAAVSQNNHRYRCVVSGACTPAVTSNAAILNVTAPASINSQPADVVFCGSGNAVFTVTATGTGLAYQWQLSTNGGTTYNNITGATTATLNVNATSTSFNDFRYRVLVANAGGVCGTLTSNAAKLSVNPLPVVVLSAAPYTKLFPGLKTTVTATVTPAGGTYSWSRNGIVLPTSANTIIADVDNLGDYKLTVTGTGGCVGESNVLNILDSATNKIFFYPNPNQGRFQVRYNNPKNSNTQNYIRIFDDKGNKVYEAKYTVTRAYDQMLVDLRARGTGVYFVQLTDASGKRLATGKVVIN
jgi:Secretion system C-terminal sorting domain